ncbi:MAG: phospholipase [Rhodobacterales bacterium]|nr:phospholipase [Rhodobacterales bacterium]
MTRTHSSGTEAAQAEVVCVVIHGRGQRPEDMVAMITRHIDAPAVRFVLPAAPTGSWYDARAIDPLTDRTRVQLGAALDRIAATVAAAQADAPAARLVLAGFSQGACLAVEYLMRHGPWAGAVALFTGCRVGARGDGLPVATLGGMPVYASCGDADPWIPAASFYDMLADLTTAGARIRADMFPGRPHMVTGTEVQALTDILADVASGQSPQWGA